MHLLASSYVACDSLLLTKNSCAHIVISNYVTSVVNREFLSTKTLVVESLHE